ncbi:MAG: ribonuclease J [Chloroflexi bacterium]|uniref:ribonuclease J n=1 Tax=Candidatus Flexifilum breve TaxID=3140694 RepID=UPI003135CE4D|nr:ribonuclease J [Chloroflexota bacterium]
MAKTKPKLRIVPIGGCGEIGKNMTLFEYGRDAFIIDTGVMFPANDMLGVDYIIPDFRYILERKDLILHGIVYTHGHEDHTGAVSHVIDQFRKVPIYATPLTAALLEVKLRDARLSNETTINVFKPGDTITVGPFTLESYHVTHSIPDCVGFGINTPHGLIVYSGDYKFDNTPIDGKRTDYAKLAEFSRRGVLMLMGDSTNSEKPGWTQSEIIVNAAFDDIFRDAKGRIIVATFASHISRIQQVANLARRYGRKLAIAGHSMRENVKTSLKIGLLDIPDDMIVELDRISSYQPQSIVIMATGSQGEPTAVLGRLATGQHRSLDVMEGDTIVLSSHTIPGNEETVSRTINRLFQRGAEVIYDPIAPVHVSGHANQEEMRLLMSLTNTKFFMPIHGELRHLRAHARLAMQSGIQPQNVFVVENGQVIEVDRHGARMTNERIPGGYVFVDGSGVGDIGRAVFRDREILARDGFMMVVATVDADGRLIGDPEIISRGFIYLKDADELLEQTKSTVIEVLNSTRQIRNGRRRDRLQEALSRMLYNETKRRPMVFSLINER